jgi:adenylate cyclase
MTSASDRAADGRRDESAATRAEAWRRIERNLTLALSAANVLGATIVFLFLGVVVPVPSEVAHDWNLLWVNLAVFVPGGVITTIVAIRAGRRLAAPVMGWFVEGRTPTPAERARTLREPLIQMKLGALLWAGGLLIFTTLNAFASLRLAALIAFTVALGGLSACALTYLLTERLGREITAATLASGVPDQPAGPSVGTRVVLTWTLATAIPVLGGMLLAIAVLTGADVSAEQVAGTVLFLGVFGLGFGLVAMRLTARSLADPIESVRAAVREVQAGNLEAEVPVYDGSEIGLLQAGFNRMADGLRERERLHDLFGRQVGTDVARQALDRGVELGGETRECAVLFVDIVGSTALAATRPARDVVEVLNRFFAIVIEVVHAHGGWVNKFEGDAALCVFGVPVDPGRAATRALAAARELDARLRDEVREIEAAIGLSWGPVVAGNVGAAERYEYTVIGDPVNEAARLSELAKERPQRALASDSIVSAADRDEAGRWQLGESLTLRGRVEPTRVAEPAVAARSPS